MKNYWFTSDLHLNHNKIIEYAKRPFPDVFTMNREIITRWNGRVKEEDDVYILGDVGMGDKAEVVEMLYELHGNIFLVPGNHDVGLMSIQRFRDRFVWIRSLAEISIPTDPADKKKHQRITLCHYAMKVWNKSHHGAWQLYGHSHGNLRDDPHSRQLDVGVDCWDFYPASFAQIQVEMDRKEWKPIDHHGAKED
jgi:calcineurin-like phosphoesterase family protein